MNSTEFKPSEIAYQFMRTIIMTVCTSVMFLGRLVYFIGHTIKTLVAPELQEEN